MFMGTLVGKKLVQYKLLITKLMFQERTYYDGLSLLR